MNAESEIGHLMRRRQEWARLEGEVVLTEEYRWAADEIERLRAALVDLRAEVARLTTELTVANNRLWNAVGALADAGTVVCAGPDDVAAGIYRLIAERDEARAEAENLRVIMNGADYPFEM